MADDRPRLGEPGDLTVLDRVECRRLPQPLRGAHRPQRGRSPVIVPVNYAVDGDQIVICSARRQARRRPARPDRLSRDRRLRPVRPRRLERVGHREAHRGDRSARSTDWAPAPTPWVPMAERHFVVLSTSS